MSSPTLPEQLLATYREEAAERVAELEAALLELDARPDDPELVARAFRALHTIKGSGAMFGLDVLAGFAHAVEAVFDAVRSGRVAVTRELVSLSLSAKDHIRDLLLGGGDPGERDRLIAGLRRFLPPGEEQDHLRPPALGETEPRRGPVRQRTYRIRFRPDPNLFQNGTNVLGLLAELRRMGSCEAVARTEWLPPLETLEPEACFLAWDVLLTCDRTPEAVRDVFAFVEERCALEVMVVEAGEGDPDEVTPGSVRPAVTEQEHVREEQPRRQGAAIPETASSIRVAASKLDRLVDLVGGLVIAQARLARLAAQSSSPVLISVAEDIDRLTAELRDGTFDVRMVPIGTTFARFKRLVRDLAGSLDKEIELVTQGAETELDKTVIERLADPLVHLIRNSCDHGIESPAVREAAGKPARGTVRLSAFHAGPNVVIEVHDDGAGLDAAAIEAKARERGLLAPTASLPERELFNLVFLPGFSTAHQVSSVSGRGVGMDVVKRSVEALRGSVSVESRTGQGSTFRIQLPLTLAIIEGLLVAVGENRYVLPLSSVEEILSLRREDVRRSHGSRVTSVRGELVPYLLLRELFGIPGSRPDVEQIAIVHHGGNRCGLVVDSVLGHHQTVIKPMGKLFAEVKGVSGATILGDGTVALIVDPAVLTAIPVSAPAQE